MPLMTFCIHAESRTHSNLQTCLVIFYIRVLPEFMQVLNHELKQHFLSLKITGSDLYTGTILCALLHH